MKEQMSKGRRSYRDESAVIAICTAAVAAKYTPAPRAFSDRSANNHLGDALRNRRPVGDVAASTLLPRARVFDESNFAPFVPLGREIQGRCTFLLLASNTVSLRFLRFLFAVLLWPRVLLPFARIFQPLSLLALTCFLGLTLFLSFFFLSLELRLKFLTLRLSLLPQLFF